MPSPLPPRPSGYASVLRWLDDLRDWVIAIRPLASLTCKVHETPAGTLILPDPAGTAGSAAAALPFPFRVRTRTTPDSDPPTLDRIVSIDSRLVSQLSPLVTETITGLAASLTPAVDDPAWKLFALGEEDEQDVIWLEVECTDGVPSAYAIKSLGAGDEWLDFEYSPGNEARCLVQWEGDGTSEDPYLTTKTRAIIALGPSDEAEVNPRPRLVQVAHTDFQLSLWDVDGKALYVLSPFSGGV